MRPLAAPGRAAPPLPAAPPARRRVLGGGGGGVVRDPRAPRGFGRGPGPPDSLPPPGSDPDAWADEPCPFCRAAVAGPSPLSRLGDSEPARSPLAVAALLRRRRTLISRPRNSRAPLGARKVTTAGVRARTSPGARAPARPRRRGSLRPSGAERCEKAAPELFRERGARPSQAPAPLPGGATGVRRAHRRGPGSACL